jgi:glycosyltransferase involved in cell wall biosynthesis
MPRARLIIKGVADDPFPALNHSQIIYLRANLLRSQINALYELADVYVSAHHSEAWGLTLSDAMIFEKPVVAPNYSGNLEFMNPFNSFLIETSERNIEALDCSELFQSTMKWGYPSEEDLSEKLTLIYTNLHEPIVTERIKAGQKSIQVFNRAAVSELILDRLGMLTERCTADTT